MRVAISGASGLIGSALTQSLQQDGHEVLAITRDAKGKANAVEWAAIQPGNAPAELEGLDAVVHLAGEPIAQLWTKSTKEAITQSRVELTRRLSETLAGLERPPKVFLSGSAIGYYGDQGDTVLEESAPAGELFVSAVGKAWEESTKVAESAGLRTAHLRTGIVLSTRGGALKAMLPAFKFGVAGRLGDGQQWMSWIHLEDMVGAIRHCIDTPEVHGAVNMVAPNPETNAEYTKKLAGVLKRPAILPAPAFVLKALLDDLATNLLLASTRVTPKKLQESGFTFQYPELTEALKDLLARKI